MPPEAPGPEVRFTGPVDGALGPVGRGQLSQALREALEMISRQLVPVRVAVTAADGTCAAQIETRGPLPHGDPASGWPARLGDSAAEAGISRTVQAEPEGTRFTWSVSP